MSDLNSLEIAALTGMDTEVFADIDSTNSEARRQIVKGLHHDKLIVSDSQSGGRGRRGRSFHSPSGKGIYMTLVLFPDELRVNDSLMVTSLTAVAVSRALEKHTEEKTGIKWVNDLYLRGKKIAGILVEAISDFSGGTVESLIIGIGANVRPQVFPEDLPDAGYIDLSHISRNTVISDIALEVTDLLNGTDEAKRTAMDEYRKRSVLTGKKISFEENGIKIYGTVTCITDEGHRLVDADGKELELSSGEISVRGLF